MMVDTSEPLPKCARCSGQIQPDDPATFIEGEWFHRVCWRRSASEARIIASRAQIQQSRKFLASARLRIDKRQGKLPPGHCPVCGEAVSLEDSHPDLLIHRDCITRLRDAPAEGETTS